MDESTLFSAHREVHARTAKDIVLATLIGGQPVKRASIWHLVANAYVERIIDDAIGDLVREGYQLQLLPSNEGDAFRLVR
jgi:hypothetical protein